jgi:hypothetical protein
MPRLPSIASFDLHHSSLREDCEEEDGAWIRDTDTDREDDELREEETDRKAKKEVNDRD